MIPKRLLKRLSVRQLQEAIRLKKRLDKAARLERLLERHRREAAKLQRKIDRLMGTDHATAKLQKRTKPHFSAEARRRIAEAQRARWARLKGHGNRAAAKPGRRPRFSAATRRKMAEAQRRRWAKVKAAKAEA